MQLLDSISLGQNPQMRKLYIHKHYIMVQTLKNTEQKILGKACTYKFKTQDREP